MPWQSSTMKTQQLRHLYFGVSTFVEKNGTLRLSCDTRKKEHRCLPHMFVLAVYFQSLVAFKWISLSNFRSHKKLCLIIVSMPQSLVVHKNRVGVDNHLSLSGGSRTWIGHLGKCDSDLELTKQLD